MFCPKCGAKVLDGAEFCQKCGTKLAANTSTSNLADSPHPKNRTTVADPKRKKSKKLFIILGVVLAFIVILIVANADNLAERGAQDQKDEEHIKSQQQDSASVNLSETYINEEEGFSFNYPSAWVPVSEEEYSSRFGSIEGEEYPLVLLANETDDLPEANTYIMVSKIPATQDAINHLFIDDEQFAATFDNDVTIKNTLTAEIDGVAAREITYLTSDGIGYQSYFYAIGTAIYRIDFSWRGETSGNNQRFFDAIIDSYKITSPETATVTDTFGKLLCKNISVDAIMQMTADEVIATFGEPEIYIENESIEYGADAPEWMYFDISSGNTVFSFSANSEEFTLNGQGLNLYFDDLVSLLGNDYNCLGGSGYEWIIGNLSYIFYIPPKDYIAYSLVISKFDTDVPVDNDALLEQNEYYTNSDSELYGRWRSSEGNSIELSEGGSGSMSFCLWSQDQLGKCDYILWQANNGHLTLEPHFSYQMNYEYMPKSEKNPHDYIALPIWGKFYRVKGTEGDSIVGSWAIESVNSDRTSLGLYEDGTGYWYGHDAYYWNATDTNLEICISLQTGCDYYVAGDMLELFFSNGSMIFTRVGS